MLEHPYKYSTLQNSAEDMLQSPTEIASFTDFLINNLHYYLVREIIITMMMMFLWGLFFLIVMFNNSNILLILLMFLSHFIDLIESMQRERERVMRLYIWQLLTYVRIVFCF